MIPPPKKSVPKKVKRLLPGIMDYTKRQTKDGPWAWFNKAALQKIRDSCDQDFKAVLAVYLALCEIASDESNDEFTASMDRIGGKCGYSRRAVFGILDQLEDIGVIAIYHSKTTANFRVPSSYLLLRCEPASQRCATSSQRCEILEGA